MLIKWNSWCWHRNRILLILPLLPTKFITSLNLFITSPNMFITSQTRFRFCNMCGNSFDATSKKHKTMFITSTCKSRKASRQCDPWPPRQWSSPPRSSSPPRAKADHVQLRKMSQIIHSRHTHAKMLSPAVTERLLTRMGQHGSPQMISRRKRIITLGADERRFTLMR